MGEQYQHYALRNGAGIPGLGGQEVGFRELVPLQEHVHFRGSAKRRHQQRDNEKLYDKYLFSQKPQGCSFVEMENVEILYCGVVNLELCYYLLK